MASADQALSLLSAATNHADLVVKLSSLKQAKDILLSLEPSFAAELFPYLAKLQFSPEPLVRKMLVEIVEEIGLKSIKYCSIFIPILMAFLKDTDSVIARKSIVCGTHLFCGVLEEMAVQHEKAERWLEELWIWMLKFKDAVFAVALEPGSVGTKLLSLKFLETYVLMFTPDANDSDLLASEGTRRLFNVSWVAGGHPILNQVALMSDADQTLRILLDFLQSPGSLSGSLIIAVINCLAAIARKRPLLYDIVLPALLDFNPNLETVKGCHPVSIQYSLRTAFLRFLRCMHPTIFESRDRLIRALRAMNAGDAADQVIRQVDKMLKNNEGASREARFSRDDQASSQISVPRDQLRKRSAPLENEELANGHEMLSKRIRHGPNNLSNIPNRLDGLDESISVNETSSNDPLMDRDLTPAEQMIAMIGALLAEGERGAESLGILVSNIDPDLLADIVITNMKHLPKTVPPLTRVGNSQAFHQMGHLNGTPQVAIPSTSTSSIPPVSSADIPYPVTAANSLPSDRNTANNLSADSKRDPRRDPRRLDPRRAASSVDGLSTCSTDDFTAPEPESHGSISLTKPLQVPSLTCIENPPEISIPNSESHDKVIETTLGPNDDQENLKEEVSVKSEEMIPISEVEEGYPDRGSSLIMNNEDSNATNLSDLEVKYEYDDDKQPSMEYDLDSPTVSNSSIPEETCQDLPELPPYIDLTELQKQSVKNLAVERIIESYKNLEGTDSSLTRMALLARLVAQIDADDIVMMLQKHIAVDYRLRKGHELSLQILYHLHSLMVQDSLERSSCAADVYEKFLLAVAKTLLDTLPASDKSFSRFLGEVPLLPESALNLLDELCCSEVLDSHGKEVRDGERVTQGLGAVWGLILGRPSNRQACLDIALKCAVHSQDDIRAKAIRLVANKLYQLKYVADDIEQFATKMFLSAGYQHTSNTDLSQSGSVEQREGEVGSQEASISGSQVSDSGTCESTSTKGAGMAVQNSSMSLSEAQQLISLLFALCTQKPRLLQLVFDAYGQAPKAVKQAVHRHIPILLRALGSSNSELLSIISDPPEGCENLLMLVLQKLTQETTPSSDLIATVKHLYETKLKDATVLIPILSSLSKNEVLPIFPRLVGLPTEKFKMAIAHILQGSANTGPALTPAEVLVAIHDINPEKDGLPLKKVTDACSACFEQRTIFTQQVLAKALNQMVDQTPLPLLFMRTVIQAIDAFPTLVDFVMEILSKLVNRQVWKMPKLWVGFLKCASQTRPHSFGVLLQLPAPVLESAMIKHANLKGPLATYANQPSIRTSLPRATLAVLGLVNDSQSQQPQVPSVPAPP